MATVKLDTIKDAGLSVRIGKATLKRSAVVSGLTGTKETRLISALNVLPAYRSLYPGRTDLILTDIDITPAAPGVANAILTYESPEIGALSTAYTYELLTQTVQEESNYNREGGVIGVDFEYTDKDGNPRADRQHPLIRKMRPMAVLRATRAEMGPISLTPLSYVGACNDAPWGSGAKYSWMCTSINKFSNDRGASYATSYEFTYHPDTWYAYAYYFDRNGKIPRIVETTFNKNADPGEYNGWTKVVPYEMKNFSAQFGNP